jgi:copper(I)-binding protein
MYMRTSLAMAAAACLATPIAARDFTTGPIRIGQPWARETSAAQTVGGGYLSLANKGRRPDRLVSATSPAAREVQFHSMSMDRGVMRMRRLSNGIAIPAGATVALAPSGLHIMFVGLKGPLKRGTSIPAELRFERAGTIRIAFTVEPISAQGPGRDQHGRH